MPYCPNCGNAINPGDRFCANCGMGLHAVTTAVPAAQAANPVRSDYRLVLVSRGTCSRAVAIDMLSDLLGYSDPDAARIIDNAPMEVALGLTAIQAQYISQAITEYGMEVAIFNSEGYVDMGSRATASVYDSDGSILSAVAGVLASLTMGNRITAYNRWTQPAPVLFRPAYQRRALPAYRRRRPAPIPTVRHASPPIRRAAPVPTPAPPSSVASSRPQPVRPAPTPQPMRPTGPVTPPHPVAPGPNNGMGRNGRGGPGGPGGPVGPGGSRRG